MLEKLHCSLNDDLASKFVCLFVWGFSSHSWNFHSYGDVTIADEGLQILTYAQYSWSLSSEGSFACNTYCDTGGIHLGGPVTLTPIAECLAVELLQAPPVLTTGRRDWDSSTQPSACKVNSLTHYTIAATVC